MAAENGQSENAQSEKAPTEKAPTEKAPTDLELKIIKQIEYYFGDINLPRDRFLQEQITQDDGWVTLETMLKFNRLKQLSPEEDVICAALKNSTSGLMEISEDKKKIRRSPEMPIPDNTKERRDELSSRSIYAKGFPLEITLDQIQEFFAQHGKIENVLMRRIPKTKDFKGSVFVVFSNKDEAKKFVETESVKYEETELVRHLKDDYYKQKTARRQQAKSKVAERTKKEEEAEDEKLRERVKHATILRLEGLPGDITLEDVRNFFSDFGTVAWVDHTNGETKGYVRFSNENEATEVLVKAKAAGEGKIEINNNDVEARVLDGEEELNHWKMIFKTMEDQRKNRGKNFNNSRGGGGRGGGRGGKRRNNYGNKGNRRGPKEQGDGEPAAKVAKTSDD